jgi:molecular chaperone DnaK (HSP70)
VNSSWWALAIDFGTSFTTGAVAVDGGAPAVVEVENSRYFPSIVVVDSAGQLLTGRAAVSQAAVYPERTVRVPKRALVAGPEAVLPGGAVAVTDLAAAVLRRVYGEAVRLRGGQPPDRVVLTHPARWGTEPLGRLREAAVKAGIPATESMPEPVAAAWQFAAPSSGGGPIGVFDLGGGTLDTAVLRPVADGFEIAGPPGGDADLGGEDFDETLLGWFSQLAWDRDEAAWKSVFSGNDIRSRRDLALLQADVTAAKEALSENLTYELPVPGFTEGFRVTRPEFIRLIGEQIDGAVTEMWRTIAAAEAQPGNLAGIYLAGGSSRIPMVAERLATGLGVQPLLRDDPKTAVVLGALTAITSAARQTRPTARARPAATARAAASRPAATARAAASRPAATARAVGSRLTPTRRAAGSRLAAAMRAIGSWLAAAMRAIGSWLAHAMRAVGSWLAATARAAASRSAVMVRAVGSWLAATARRLHPRWPLRHGRRRRFGRPRRRSG